MQPHPRYLASLALALTPLAAQDAHDVRDPFPPVDRAELRVALHTAPADPASGDYGLWAMGPTYKAGFHDGFRFVPLLGAAEPENLPLIWRTRSVRHGDIELTATSGGDATTTEVVTDWRHERRSGAVTEIHDIRPEGVEQSFVITAAPAPGEDLVVTADIDGPLRGDPTDARHGPITFRDARGRAIVEYGAAIAFDARGDVIEVTTRCDGREVRLVVGAEWLAAATLPVTIDPLVRTIIADSSNTDIHFTDVVRNDQTDDIFLVYSVAASGADFDQIAQKRSDDLNRQVRVFADITTDWSATHGRVTYVPGVDRYAMAMQRRFTNGNSRVRVYLHDRDSDQQNSGRTLFPEPGLGLQDADPAIGGNLFGGSDRALVTFRRDASATAANTEFSEVRAMAIDCANRTVAGEVGIGGDRRTIDAESPSVNRFRTGSGGSAWVVTWQENLNRPGDAWAILARQVFEDTSVTTHLLVAAGNSTRHRVRARLDGAFGRYLAVWVEQPNTRKNTGSFGRKIEARRFDWAEGASPTTRPIRVVAAHPTRQDLQLDAGHPIAYDTDTDSHWMVAWAERGVGILAARLGFDGETSESITVRNRPSETVDYPSICYDDDAERFLIGYVSRDSAARVRLADVRMPAARAAGFGARCPARLRFTNNGDDLPYAGSEFGELTVSAAASNAPIFVFAALAPAAVPIPLPSTGGCRLLLEPTAILGELGVGATGASGSFEVPLSIPSVVDGELFVQAVVLNGTDLQTSEGLHLTIR